MPKHIWGDQSQITCKLSPHLIALRLCHAWYGQEGPSRLLEKVERYEVAVDCSPDVSFCSSQKHVELNPINPGAIQEVCIWRASKNNSGKGYAMRTKGRGK